MRALIFSHAAIRSSNRRAYRALAEAGVDVTLVVPDRWKSGLGFLRAEPEPPDSRLGVVVCKRFGASHSNMYWLSGFNAVARRCSPNAIYVDEDPAGFAAAQGALIAGSCHAGLVVLGIQNILKRYPVPFQALQRFVFNRSRTAVCTSDQAARTLKERGFNGWMTRMPFSTDLVPLSRAVREEIRAKYDLPSPAAGYVGRLTPEKGVDVFLHALSRLPDVSGVIVGDGPERDALERLAHELGIAQRVRFLGVQPPAAAAKILGTLEVLVLASLTRPHWSEQFGRVLIEAMASGVPIVASDSGAIAEVVGDAGTLVPEGDGDALARAVERSLKDGAELRSRGLRRVRAHFTAETEMRALREALEVAAHYAACA